ncbi:MAG TPA: hypothetical protein EYN67_09400 [Flavobacteriales bacterium]|nr:hypothetical protein [Flavobacteriales bacterium]
MIFTWQQIPSPIVTEILCNTGCDGIVIDTEHGGFNDETVISCIQVATLSGKKCFVRLTEISKTKIRYYLDSGASGLIFSTVETYVDAEKIIEYSCFAPRGARGLGLVRQNMWGAKELLSLDPILIPQIETKCGVENLKEISSLGFDYYLIGPYDLSLSLGVPGKFDNDDFMIYITKINDIISKEKIAVHIPSNVQQELHKYEGYGLKCLGMDTIALIEYHKEIIRNA